MEKNEENRDDGHVNPCSAIVNDRALGELFYVLEQVSSPVKWR